MPACERVAFWSSGGRHGGRRARPRRPERMARRHSETIRLHPGVWPVAKTYRLSQPGNGHRARTGWQHDHGAGMRIALDSIKQAPELTGITPPAINRDNPTYPPTSPLSSITASSSYFDLLLPFFILSVFPSLHSPPLRSLPPYSSPSFFPVLCLILGSAFLSPAPGGESRSHERAIPGNAEHRRPSAAETSQADPARTE